MTGSYFKTLQSFKANYCPSEFTLYESSRTGLRVAVVNQKGPKIYGDVVLATEIHDDSGAPHTLEHLVFMGSKKNFRYKGLLDKFSSRSYSSINAYTDIHHTAYQLESAGWEGFAQMLPIYLEHVFLPLLTDSACYTEVHHIDGEGNDAGVVYSEMQGRQNGQQDLMDIHARRLIYPQGDGFRSETGGLMENLRVLTADRIREFHKEMYQPKNTCLMLMGEVDHVHLLRILDKFEDQFHSDFPPIDAPFKRPFIESQQTLKLDKTIVDTVEFPEEDESTGEVQIHILGPHCTDEISLSALNILLVYLCGSSIALLDNVLVEKEQLASMVCNYESVRPSVLIMFVLSGVETSKLESVLERFFVVLREHAKGPMDMAYMKDCLDRSKRQRQFVCEGSANSFSTDLVNDHLYGKRDGSNLLRLSSLHEYDILAQWGESTWRAFFSKWIANAKYVSVLGKPSQELSTKIKEEEVARVQLQRKKLGEDGMRKLQEKLDAAKEQNDQEAPEEIHETIKVPSTDSIHFIPTMTARSGLAKRMGKLENKIQTIVDKDASESQLFIHFEHIPSNFVRIYLAMGTAEVPESLRPLFPVYLLNFFDTPVMRDGKRLEFEDVVLQLEKDTIDYSIDGGRRIGNAELLKISFQVETQKYDSAIAWIRDFLFNSIFDKSRLQSTLAKLVADIPEEKREGSMMSNSIVTMLNYTRNTSTRASDTLVKALYLRRTQTLLKKSPEIVIERFERLRECLTQPSNIRVLVIANLESGALPTPVSSWSAFTGKDWPKAVDLNPIDSCAAGLSQAAKHPGKFAYVVPMPTIDSSFGVLCGRGPDSFDHHDLPALMVASAYLDSLEEPLWSAVRGAGLAYATGVSKNIMTGILQFSIYRSPDAYKAFTVSKDIIKKLVVGKIKLSEMALEGAKSSVVTGFANEQPTMASAAATSFIYQVIREIPKEWATDVLKKVRATAVDDIKQVIEKFVLPLFAPATANLVITCATIMEEGLVENFKKEGFKVEVQKLAHFQDDYGLEVPGDENEALDSEEDEGAEIKDEEVDEAGDEDAEHNELGR